MPQSPLPRAITYSGIPSMIEYRDRVVREWKLELVVGKNASRTYEGVLVGPNGTKRFTKLAVGDSVDFGGGRWKIVGIFDAGGSAFDSEVWCDAPVLNEVLKRPDTPPLMRLLVDEHNLVTREWRFNPSTTSFSTGVFGLALVAALLVLRPLKRTAPAIPRGAARLYPGMDLLGRPLEGYYGLRLPSRGRRAVKPRGCR